MYAIFIFNTLKLHEPIPDRKAKFYCRTLGIVPTMLDAANKLSDWVGKESMYTKKIYTEDFIESRPGIWLKFLDWNQTVIMLVDDTQMSVIEEWPEEIFNIELEL